MDHQRVAAAAFDHHRPAEEAADRRRQDVEAAAEQGQPGEFPFELAGPLVELGPAVDEIADHAALDLDRISPGEPERDQPRLHSGPTERVEQVIGIAVIDQQDRRDMGPDERPDELADPRPSRLRAPRSPATSPG